VMEETRAKSTPYSLETWHNRVQWLTEWENCVFTQTIVITFKWHLTHCSC
jgi:hypothetical protein